jgi:hypothetical protein
MNALPDWAKWVAMDEDGVWWCYEVEPHQHGRGWYENEVGRTMRLLDFHLKIPEWRLSLKRVEDLDDLNQINQTPNTWPDDRPN